MTDNSEVSRLASYKVDERPCLLQYASQCRLKGLYNDVTIKVNDVCIPANRMVLSCYSQFFEKNLNKQTNEEDEGRVIEINDVDGQSLKLLIDFIYYGILHINSYTVVGILKCASYLELNDVKYFCFDYLEKTMTPINCFHRLTFAHQYENFPFKQRIHVYISENFEDVARGEEFQKLNSEILIPAICQLRRSHVQEAFLCKSLLNWIKHNETERKKFLHELLRFIDFNKLPLKVLKRLAEDSLLVEEEKYMNLINLRIKKLMQTKTSIYKCVCAPLTLRHPSLAPLWGICTGCVFSEKERNEECKRKVKGPIPNEYRDQRENQTKIISIGGKRTNSKLIEVFSLTKTSSLNYPDLPSHLITRHAVKFNKSIYCFGIFSRIFKMDLYQKSLHWQEVSLTKTRTNTFGAAVFNDTLVVCMGFNGESQVYKTNLNQWDLLPTLNRKRLKIELVATSQYLFAVGGHNGWKSVSTVERLPEVNGTWEVVAPMKTPRHAFAVVNYRDNLYAIGGEDHKSKKLKSVEKYDPASNEWVSVSDMRNDRWKHAACVFYDRIFVVGGLNSNGEVVNEIEYYDPIKDNWEIVVGKIKDDLYGHSLIVV